MPIIYHSCEIHSRNINSRKKKSSAECNKLTSTTGNRAAIMGDISSNSCYNRERSHLFPYISSLYTQLQPKRNKKKKKRHYLQVEIQGIRISPLLVFLAVAVAAAEGDAARRRLMWDVWDFIGFGLITLGRKVEEKRSVWSSITA